METAIVSIICIALIVVGGMTMSKSFLSSVDTTAVGLEEVSNRDKNILRTSLSIISASQTAENILRVRMENIGQVKLNDFDKWDIIVHYYDSSGNYHVKWLPYTDYSLEDNEWTKDGIYIDSALLTAEAFEPEILNPDEEMIIRAQLNPVVGIDTVNTVIISTSNGVSTSATFIGYAE